MIMKVFACKNQYPYGGGLILVAAHSKEEAFLTAQKDGPACWLFYTKNGNVVSDIYPFEEWFEVKYLSTDLTEPKLIIEDHYSE